MKFPKKFWLIFGPVLGVILLAAIAGGIFVSHKKKPTTAAINTTSTSQQQTAQSQAKNEPVKQDAPASTPTAEQPKTSTNQTGSSAPKTPPPVIPQPSIPPFKITSISMNGAFYLCSGGTIVTYISSVTFNSSNAQGGAVTWVLDGENDMGSVSSDPRTDTIPYNQVSITVSDSTPANPGYLYTDMEAKQGDRIRVRTISPNAAYSSWLQIPADYVCN